MPNEKNGNIKIPRWGMAIIVAFVTAAIAYGATKITIANLIQKTDTLKIETKSELRRIDQCKLEKESFEQYTHRRDEEFKDFRQIQKEIQKDLNEIKIDNAVIKQDLKGIRMIIEEALKK